MNLNFRKFAFGLVALLLTLPAFAQEEEEFISTWGFAKNIGWKGIEFQAGFSFNHQTYYKNLDELKFYSRPANPAELDTALKKLSEYRYSEGVFYQYMAPFQLSGVFLPFRHSKYKVIRRTEWHCGLELLGAYEKDNYYSEGKTRGVLFRSRSLFLSNKLQAELRLTPYTKFYGGIQARISLIPNEQIQFVEYIETSNNALGNKTILLDQLNSTRFAFGGGLTAGIKLALTCRFNIHFEYRYDGMIRYMQQGNLSNSYRGVSVGLRYKFVKPDDTEGTSYGPFW